MAQPRIIKYLENGVYKYASVKSVGDLEKLKTRSKEDIVSAINELISSGAGGVIDPELLDKIAGMENDLGLQKEIVDGIIVEIDLNDQHIQEMQRLQDEVNAKAEELLRRADVNDLNIEQITNDILDKASVEYVDGKLVSKIDASVFEEEYKKISDDLLSKVDNEKYQEEYNSIVEDLRNKVNDSDFRSLSGQFTDIQKEVTDLEEEVGTKLSKTEFDDAVGVNKWIASKYDITGMDLSQTPPSFALIREQQAVEVEEVDDSEILQTFTGDHYIAHYFTNIYLKDRKTVGLRVKYDDSLAVYMNGAKIYENKYNDLTVTDISMSLRSGWNTVEILHGQETGTPLLDLGVKLSGQVDKLTTTIGVGDKNESRLTLAETAIRQTTEEIELKASKDVVEQIGNQVTAQEASLKIMANEIESSVKEEEFSEYTKKLETAESNITQNAEAIKQKVDQGTYDSLNEIVTKQGSEISQLADDITFKVGAEEFNGLSDKVSNQETQINLNKEAISLKAEKEELDNVDGRLAKAEGSLEVATEEISMKVSREEFDKLEIGGRNLIRNGDFSNEFSNWYNYRVTPTVSRDDRFKYVVKLATNTSGSAGWVRTQPTVGFKKGDRLVVSLWMKADVPSTNVSITLRTTGSDIEYLTESVGSIVASDWGKHEYHLVVTKDSEEVSSEWGMLISVNMGRTIDIAQVKLEKGTKATDFTPAPEDVNDSIDSVKNGLSDKVDYSMYTQKTGELTTSIEEINTKVSETEITVNDLTNEVVSTREQFNEVKQTAEGSFQKISKVEADLESLEIGGRNLVLNSNTTRSSSAYNVYNYNMSNDWEPDTDYTVAIKGEINTGQSFGIWANVLSTKVASPKYDSKTGLHIAKFKTPSSISEVTPKRALVYNVPSNTAQTAKIEWIKIVKGNAQVTDWSPAPEDVDNAISGLSSKVTTAETNIESIAGEVKTKAEAEEVNSLGTKVSKVEQSISALEGAIVNKVEKTEFDSLQIGGGNLLDNSRTIQEFTNGSSATYSVIDSEDEPFTRVKSTSTQGYSFSWWKTDKLILNEEYVISFDIRSSARGTIRYGVRSNANDGVHETFYPYVANPSNGKWVRVGQVFKFTKPYNQILILAGLNSSGEILDVKNIKVEKGNKWTGWSPSVGDMESYIEGSGYRSRPLKVRYIRDWLNGNNKNSNNHWVEIQAMRNGENVALKKSVTSNTGNNTNISRVTDGVINATSSGYYAGRSGQLDYVEVDLGSVYSDLEYVHIWHYYADNRSYLGTKTEVSEDGSTWVTLFDSEITGRYDEAEEGRVYTVNAGNGLATSSIRLSTAEQKITPEAITSTVTSSTPWKNQATQITQNSDKVSIVVGSDNKVKGSVVASAITADSNAINLISNNINLNGKVTFTSLDTSTQSKINTIETTAKNAQSGIDNLEFGGRNLLTNTSEERSFSFSGWNQYYTDMKADSYGVNEIQKGGKFILSGYIENKTGSEPVGLKLYCVNSSGYREYTDQSNAIGPNSNGFFEMKINAPADSTISRVYISMRHSSGTATSSSGSVKFVKLEKGTGKATDWTPAPEDVDGSIGTASKNAKNDAISYVDDNTGNLVKNPAVTGTATGWSASGLSVSKQTFEGVSTSVLQSSVSSDTQNYSKYFKVDPSKAYQVSMWVKKSATGRFYIGLNGVDSSDTTVGFIDINGNGTVRNSSNTNFYFTSGNATTSWTQIIGYIMPSGTTPADMKGIGTFLSSDSYGCNAIMPPNVDRIRVRFLNWLNAGTTRQLWVANPKVVEVDPNAVIQGTLAKGTVDDNKSTWDRSTNINSNGTFNTSKLNGTVSEAQINTTSTGKWNTANADTTRWKVSGKTTINGGQIEADTVTATQIKVTSLSALSANIGNVTAGNVTGVNIKGSVLETDATINNKYENARFKGTSFNFMRFKAGVKNPNPDTATGAEIEALCRVFPDGIAFADSVGIATLGPDKFVSTLTGGFTLMPAGGLTVDTSSSTFTGKIDANGNITTKGDLNANGKVYIKGSRYSSGFVSDANYTVLRSTYGNSGDGLLVGADSSKARIWSMDIYNRTYSSASNVHITGEGTLGRSTSATKYKLYIKDVETEGYAEKILNLKPRSWFDKFSVETYADFLSRNNGSIEGIEEALADNPDIRRHYGLIAEDLVAVGLENYVSYGEADEDGHREVEGIEYDRLWTLLIPLVKELRERIQLLEEKNNQSEIKER